MDKEKVKRLNALLTTFKKLRENGSVQEVSFRTSDKNYGMESEPEFIQPLLDTMIMTIEHQLELAKFGKPSEYLQESREYKAAMALENAVNSFSFNPERFAEAIPYMHRTLQQNIFRLIRSCICAMANAEDWRIDDRNRASHAMCKALVETIKEYPLPYI